MHKHATYRLLLLFAFLCSVHLVSAQSDRKPYIDSVLNSFGKLKGEKRIQTIAKFNRHANFHETPHERFKPYQLEAEKWEEKNPNPKLKNTLRLGRVNMLIAERNDAEAAGVLQEILRSGSAISREDSLSTYNFLLGIYIYVEAYSKAWEMQLNIERIYTHTPKNDPDFVQIETDKLSSQAIVLIRTKRYEEAKKAYKKYINHLLAGKIPEKNHLLAGAYNNWGLCYLETDVPDSAIFYFNKSIHYWKKRLDELDYVAPIDAAFLDLVNGNIGSAYNLQGNYEKALPLLKKDLKTSLSFNDPGSTINCYHELSASYIGLRRFSKAAELLDKASETIVDHPGPASRRRNLSLRVDLLEGLGKHKEALEMFKTLVAFNESMTVIKNEQRASVMQVIYEVEEKNHQLNQEKLKTAEAQSEAERQRAFKQNLVIAAACLFAVLIILSITAIQRRNRAKILREKNAEIEEQKAIIEQSLVEKETLLKEIHHRVKNNLQLISGILELQAVKFDDENIKVVMEEGQSRVRSMALIHQQLYQSEDLGQINFEEYLVKLVNDIVVAFNNENLKIETEINVNNLSFDVNVAVPLGLIINELVTNALKHGFEGRSEGKILISINQEENDEFLLLVHDNGNGLPKNFNADELNSLGLRLVRGLSRQLGGDYSFSNGNGTNFQIRFKNTEIN